MSPIQFAFFNYNAYTLNKQAYHTHTQVHADASVNLFFSYFLLLIIY